MGHTGHRIPISFLFSVGTGNVSGPESETKPRVGGQVWRLEDNRPLIENGIAENHNLHKIEKCGFWEREDVTAIWTKEEERSQRGWRGQVVL